MPTKTNDPPRTPLGRAYADVHVPPRYERETQGVRVVVHPVYLAEQSVPDDHRYVWAYHVEIENGSDATVQLRHRTWQIVDATGRVEQVRGPGVVGEQPVLNPGETFEYTSGCPLSTSSGFMTGHYTFQRGEGTFDVAIPAFSLDRPDDDRVVN